jgi:hypothetical protein
MDAQADQFLRFRSRQTGPFTDTTNIIDLVVPSSSDVYDLSSSFALIYVKPTVTTVRQVPGAVYQYTLGFRGSDSAISPSALVRHCRLSSSRQNRMDERRFNNRLAASLSELTVSRESKLSDAYKSTYQVTSRAAIRGGPFTEIVGEGDRPSVEREVPLYIPLSQLTDIGRVERWPMAKSGELTLRLELEPPSEFAVNWSDSIPIALVFQDLTAVNPAPNTIVAAVAYDRLEDSPFYTQQALSVTSTHSTLGPKTLLTLISEIEWIRGGPDNGRIRLTLSGAFDPIAAGQTITNIEATALEPSATPPAIAFALNINRAEILLRKVLRPGPVPSSVQFLSYQVEDLTPGGNPNPYQRVFYVPAATSLNCFLLFYDNDELHSSDPGAVSYRCAIDGQYETSEPIRFDTSQSIAQLRRALVNAGMPLADMTRAVARADQATSAGRYDRTGGSQLKLVAQPIQRDATVPGRQISVQLELAFSQGNGAGRLLLFRQEISTVKF